MNENEDVQYYMTSALNEICHLLSSAAQNVSQNQDGGRMFAERPCWNLMNKSWMLAPIQ